MGKVNKLLLASSISMVLASQLLAVNCVVSSNADSGAGTLRQCIVDVNAGSDTSNDITFNNDMTIDIQSSLPQITKNLTIDGGDNTIIVTSSNSAPSEYRQIFYFNGTGITGNLKNLEVSEVTSTAGIIQISGTGTTLNIENSKLNDNAPNDAGAVLYAQGNIVTIRDSEIKNNVVRTDGGNYAYIISKNNGGTLNIIDSNIFGNTTERADGAAIYVYTSSSNSTIINIDNSTFANNTNTYTSGSDKGSGVVNILGYGIGYQVTLNVTKSTFSGNSSDGGAVVDISSGTTLSPLSTLNFKNSTFSGNSSGSDSGVIYNGSSSALNVNFDSCTITGNTGSKASVYLSSGNIDIDNTIAVSNTPSDLYTGGNITSNGANLINNITGGTHTLSSSELGMNLDPKLGPLANNGGSTKTHALTTGSAALNAGSTSETYDQRGVKRDFDANIDIGAYEFYSGVDSLAGKDFTTQVESTSSISVTKLEAKDLSDITDPVPDGVNILNELLDVQASGTSGFSMDLVFNVNSGSNEIFTGYYKYGPSTPGGTDDQWYDLGLKSANVDGVGYEITNGGKTMTVTLKDGVKGDDDNISGQITDPGSPIVSETSTSSSSNSSSSKSSPISNFAKILMVFAFGTIAYFGLRRKKLA